MVSDSRMFARTVIGIVGALLIGFGVVGVFVGCAGCGVTSLTGTFIQSGVFVANCFSSGKFTSKKISG